MDGLTFKFFQAVFAVFGILGISIVAAGFVAYAIFKRLGSKWLDNHFAERMETFKHKQALEIEDAKYRINRLFDRASKLHQNEYVHLPGAWTKMVDAFHNAEGSLSAFQAHGNIQGVEDDIVRRHMEARGHDQDAINTVLRSGDRQKEFVKAENYFRLRRAEKSYDDFLMYLFSNQIFIRPEIAEKFADIGKLIRFALIERESELEFPGQHRSSFPSIKTFREDGQRRLSELENIVRDRLADTIPEPAAPPASQ